VTEPDGRLPRYDELPAADRGGRSGWGLFGPDDSVGLLNQQTPESVLAATRLVRRGAVFPLDAALDAVDPPLAPRRGKPRHTLLHPPGPGLKGLDDVYDNFNPQTSSQWDSLAHAAYSPGTFYNGATEDDVLADRRNTIDYWARRGIVARAVVLDLARALPASGREYRPGSGTAFTVDDLELARAAVGVSYSPGCVVLLHTGFLGWYTGLPWAGRADWAANLRAPLRQPAGACLARAGRGQATARRRHRRVVSGPAAAVRGRSRPGRDAQGQRVEFDHAGRRRRAGGRRLVLGLRGGAGPAGLPR
jgi:hypothetical protein